MAAAFTLGRTALRHGEKIVEPEISRPRIASSYLSANDAELPLNSVPCLMYPLVVLNDLCRSYRWMASPGASF
jgi:hypothetical protein